MLCTNQLRIDFMYAWNLSLNSTRFWQPENGRLLKSQWVTLGHLSISTILLPLLHQHTSESSASTIFFLSLAYHDMYVKSLKCEKLVIGRSGSYFINFFSYLSNFCLFVCYFCWLKKQNINVLWLESQWSKQAAKRISWLKCVDVWVSACLNKCSFKQVQMCSDTYVFVWMRFSFRKTCDNSWAHHISFMNWN